MSANTGIEWTDATWNVLRGCSRVSEGCRNCYAERLAGRFAHGAYLNLVRLSDHGPRWTGDIHFAEEHLADPLKWRKPKRIFVNSMSDLFHEKVKDEWIDRIFAVMALCPQHTFQVLTKRPKRMRTYLSTDRRAVMGFWATYIWHCFKYAGRDNDTKRARADVESLKPLWPLPNVWMGTSVEDQPTADKRVPELLQTPAAVRFVSYEPALAAVKLNLECGCGDYKKDHENGTGKCRMPNDLTHGFMRCDAYRGIDWVVAGGESGPHARPAHPDWFRSVRDRCQESGVPFFFKQWGEWGPFHSGPLKQLGGNATGTGKPLRDVGNYTMARFGKKAAGRLLDGREWNEYPKERS